MAKGAIKPAGYSGTPLVKKLGMKKDYRVRVVNQPANYFQLLGELPAGLRVSKDTRRGKDLIHCFLTSTKELSRTLPALKSEIEQAGSIWISWPKKSSGVETDITEDVVRRAAFAIGLVDVKVCAIDETWSGLKLVIPVKDRR